MNKQKFSKRINDLLNDFVIDMTDLTDNFKDELKGLIIERDNYQLNLLLEEIYIWSRKMPNPNQTYEELYDIIIKVMRDEK